MSVPHPSDFVVSVPYGKTNDGRFAHSTSPFHNETVPKTVSRITFGPFAFFSFPGFERNITLPIYRVEDKIPTRPTMPFFQ